MKHSHLRRLTSVLLAVLMCMSIMAATVAAILPAFADASVESHAPRGTRLVSVGSSVSVSACTNERAGSENSYEMPTERWAKKFLVDGVQDGAGWSCQPYDREMDHTKPVTVTLALPGVSEISGVSLFPNGQFPNKYEIQISSDGKTFKTVASDSGVAIGNQEVKTYTFAAESATHVRLHIIERNPAMGRDGALAQLGELAVWGTVDPGMSPDRSSLKMLVGETDTLTMSFVGIEDTPAVTFRSANEAIATVDAAGKVTARALGKTTITVTCAAYNLTATCEVHVVEKKNDFDANINLSIFWPPTPAYINDEQYKLMADAGINWVMGAGEETLATPENQKKMLELCAKYGMGMTVQDGSFGDNLLGKSEAQVAAYVEKYKNVPAAYGFYLRDEPFNPNDYVEAYINVKKAAPESSVHLNFLPLGSYGTEETYKAQMTDWCRLTAAAGYPIEYLMFDQYPFPLSGAMNRSGFFQNTRACWEVGLSEGVKTGMYIQTVKQDVAFRRPSASEIRYEMYAALAFGYKQLSFFTWFTPVNRSEPFSDGIISADGKPNAHYETIKTVNHEILAIGETLVKCDALEVWFNGPDTYGQPAVPENFFVQAEKSDSAILSFLRHKETGRNYLMVVNNNYSAEQEIKLTFDGAIKSLSEVSRTDGSLKALSMNGQTLTLNLAAGDAMLIALPEGYDYDKASEGQPAATENLAADAAVLCPTSLGSDGWYMYNLNDGYRLTGTDSAAKGWRSEGTDDTYIILDLGRELAFNRIDLYAAGTFFDYGQNFPKNIKVSVSDDGKTYAEVKAFTDLSVGKLTGTALSIGDQAARYIRLDITGMERRDRYAALNEIEIYNDDGSLPAPETFTLTGNNDTIITYKDGDNIALMKPTFASSTTPTHYEAWGWALKYINEGRKEQGGYTLGWTSNVGRNTSSNATEYVGIDFGDLFAVDKIVVQPHGAFPLDYHIDLSEDGIEWTTVSKVRNAKNNGEDVVVTLEEPVTARFIRFTATRLSSGGNAADGYLLQLGEIEAYGKPVCDKPLLQLAIDTYKDAGGSESERAYIEATEALGNDLLTQTQANYYMRRLLALVDKTIEDLLPDDTEKPVESDTVSDEKATSAAADADPTPADTLPTDADADEDADEDEGCASVLGAGVLAATLAMGAGAVTLRKKKED